MAGRITLIITINLPSLYIGALSRLTDNGEYPSRSEAIRVALNDFLTRELSMVDVLLEMNDESKKQNQPQETQKNKSKKVDMRSIRTGWK
nr:ribbon-helix-helix domain-containing protein [Candidatus Sigynarchaeota archaeon]